MWQRVFLAIILSFCINAICVAAELSLPIERLDLNLVNDMNRLDDQLTLNLQKTLDTTRTEIDSAKHLIERLYRVDLNNVSLKKHVDYVVTINFANHDYVNFILLNDDDVDTELLGDEVAFSTREVDYRLPSYRFRLDAETNPELFIQVFDSIDIGFEVDIAPQSAFTSIASNTYIAYGLFFGTILALAIYNLILLFSAREEIYAWYVLYIISTSFVLAFGNGLGQAFVWPHTEGANTAFAFMAATWVMLSMSGFAYSFLNLTRANTTFIYISVFTLGSALLINIFLVFTHHSQLDLPFYAICSVQLLNVFILSINTYVKERGVAIYLLLGYLTLVPAIFISIAMFAGLLPSSLLANHSFEASFLLEAFILSLGVGEKIRRLKHSELKAVEDLKNSKQKFLRDVMSVREAEKRELGIILHNSVAQNLAVVRTRLNKLISAGYDEQEMAKLVEFIDDTTAEVRDISQLSYPHYLEQFGLAKAVQHYAESNLDEREIDWVVDIDDIKASHEEELILYRIIQECINNVYRHAQASFVKISSTQLADQYYRIIVEDDGIGMQANVEGFGLSSIRQYAGQLNGQLHISAKVKTGSKLTIDFFLSEQATVASGA